MAFALPRFLQDARANLEELVEEARTKFDEIADSVGRVGDAAVGSKHHAAMDDGPPSPLQHRPPSVSNTMAEDSPGRWRAEERARWCDAEEKRTATSASRASATVTRHHIRRDQDQPLPSPPPTPVLPADEPPTSGRAAGGSACAVAAVGSV